MDWEDSKCGAVLALFSYVTYMWRVGLLPSTLAGGNSLAMYDMILARNAVTT